MNEEERQFVLDNVDNINADVHDIDELCCALEHSTIFAVDYIQTFATRLIDLDYKYKNLQSKIDKAIEYIENNKIYEWKTYRDENFQLQGEKIESDMISKSAILDILKEEK